MASCPQCATKLAETPTPAGPAPGCEGCHHLWIGAGQLRTLQANTPRRYLPGDIDLLRAESATRKEAAFRRTIAYLRCPGCEKRMLRRTFGTMSYLLLHYCADHGYWIHRDELEGIAAYLARGGEVLEMARTQERLRERIRHLEAQGRRAEDHGDGGSSFVPYSL